MSFVALAEMPPVREDDGLRVGTSRVLLELVIRAFDDGATPEAIVQRYNSLSLPDVYAVIAYYLRHPDLIAPYLEERERQSADLQTRIEASHPDLNGIRARLLAGRHTD